MSPCCCTTSPRAGPEDHSAAGAKHCAPHLPAYGALAGRHRTVAWLVENHLLMSMTAQTRDLNDRKTIDDFAAVVQTVERLKLLLILTVCDIRGVGPGVWNGWKGQLLRTLYLRDRAAADRRLLGGFARRAHCRRAASGCRSAVRLAASRAQPLCRLALRQLSAGRRPQRPAAAHAPSSARPTLPAEQLATMVKTHQFEGGHRDHRAGAGPSAPALRDRRRLRRRRRQHRRCPDLHYHRWPRARHHPDLAASSSSTRTSAAAPNASAG